MAAFDRADVFVLYILPHGLLELTCIFVAGAAGCRSSGRGSRPARARAASRSRPAGRSLATVAIGLVLALARRRGSSRASSRRSRGRGRSRSASAPPRSALFLVYMLVVGGRAHRRGETGDLTEYEAGTPTLVAG